MTSTEILYCKLKNKGLEVTINTRREKEKKTQRETETKIQRHRNTQRDRDITTESIS